MIRPAKELCSSASTSRSIDMIGRIPLPARAGIKVGPPTFWSSFSRCNWGWRCSLAAPLLNANRSGPEGGDLQQATRHHHVLQEVNHLVLISKIAVKRDCGRQREGGQ